MNLRAKPTLRFSRWASCSATSARARSTRAKETFNPRTASAHAANVLGVLSLDLLVADARRLGQVRRSSCAPTTAARAASGAARARARAVRDRPRLARGPRSASSAPRCSTATRVITPAISVLSAVEGSSRHRRSSPTSCRRRSAILIGAVRDPAARHRTVGRCSVRSCSRGSWPSARSASADRCSEPRSSRRSTRATRCTSSTTHGWSAFVVLGSVLLAVTGAEALYADMGHFGKRPIRLAWFSRGAARRWC